MYNDLTLSLSIAEGMASELQEQINAMADERTKDGFGFDSEQIEELKNKINNLVESINQLESEDKEDIEDDD